MFLANDKCTWFREMRAHLRLSAGFQLVPVVAEPFVKESYVFSQGADLLQPHFLCEGALDAEALVDHLPLKKI